MEDAKQPVSRPHFTIQPEITEVLRLFGNLVEQNECVRVDGAVSAM